MKAGRREGGREGGWEGEGKERLGREGGKKVQLTVSIIIVGFFELWCALNKISKWCSLNRTYIAEKLLWCASCQDHFGPSACPGAYITYINNCMYASMHCTMLTVE